MPSLEQPPQPLSKAEQSCRPVGNDATTLTRSEVNEILGESACQSELVLPLEHRYWTKEQLRLYVMSGGALRPRGCSIPDQNLLVDRELSEERLRESLATAAGWIRHADGILVGSGAGMGVGSGLATFRGGQGGVWPALAKLGISYEDICAPKWFDDDPGLAWGFWSFCHSAYRESEPHDGYRIVLKWANRLPLRSYSFTSNIDGHWRNSGWEESLLCECHGAVRWLQCSKPCSTDVWEAPENLGLQESSVNCRAEGTLPVCPFCGAVARPMVLMFGGDSGFSTEIRKKQQGTLDWWKGGVSNSSEYNPEPLLVCLELGCGITVPTVRKELEKTMEKFPFARLIRVNPENPGVSRQLQDRAVCLPMDALQALRRLDALIGEPRMGRFIVHDPWGNGTERDMPLDDPYHRILRAAVFCLTDKDPWFTVYNLDEYCGEVRHITERTSMFKRLDEMEKVPEEYFLVVDGDNEPPAACIVVSGAYWSGRNPALDSRMGRIWRLLTDLHNHFGTEDYQGRLHEVKHQQELRALTRGVHLEVLPSHGFAVSHETTPCQWLSVQNRLRGVIMSGDWWQELLNLSFPLQSVSGVDRIPSLPAASHPRRRMPDKAA